MQYNPYYILYKQFGRCGLAVGQMPRSTERISRLSSYEYFRLQSKKMNFTGSLRCIISPTTKPLGSLVDNLVA